ncbi:Helix-turn-helix of DDE superfamily endonuclease [Streptomyces yunnanensis]|uniref:Helix-turn-helix of DDE superfamily endonuclease n=1 Tax=Streptomyces yunnanensis TaxID=156453 RepID=A0A9X8R0K5_9ACTN|nr:Helix-turn-helix of DDE superfamily endonuclease [Streptomyces yunnanensis]
MLAHFCKNETYRQVGAGFGVSESTAWRYVDETLELLAAWAPGLHEALIGLGDGDFVTVDGTLIPTDRIAADEPYYSMKHRWHGMNVQRCSTHRITTIIKAIHTVLTCEKEG